MSKAKILSVCLLGTLALTACSDDKSNSAADRSGSCNSTFVNSWNAVSRSKTRFQFAKLDNKKSITLSAAFNLDSKCKAMQTTFGSSTCKGTVSAYNFDLKKYTETVRTLSANDYAADCTEAEAMVNGAPVMPANAGGLFTPPIKRSGGSRVFTERDRINVELNRAKRERDESVDKWFMANELLEVMAGRPALKRRETDRLEVTSLSKVRYRMKLEVQDARGINRMLRASADNPKSDEAKLVAPGYGKYPDCAVSVVRGERPDRLSVGEMVRVRGLEVIQKGKFVRVENVVISTKDFSIVCYRRPGADNAAKPIRVREVRFVLDGVLDFKVSEK